MSVEQLRDEVITMLFAGHETTANTLSWTFSLLAQHPEIETRAVSELSESIGTRDATSADLEQLPFLERVLLESMRLYPTAFLLGRKATESVEVGGYRIPAGTTIFMSQWVTQRDNRFFHHADSFHPNRWESGPRSLPECAFFPFGAGTRLCIGKEFGLMEAKLILATILRKFRFHLVRDTMPTPWPSVTLRPKEGVQVVVQTR